MVELISLFIVVAISGLLGLSVFYNNPNNATNKILSLFALTIIFWAFTMYLSLHPPMQSQQLMLIRLSMLAAILMSTGVLLLSHVIPSAEFNMKPKLLIPVLAGTLVGSITAMSPYMFTNIEFQGNNIEPVAGPGIIMFMITGLGYSVSGIFILLKKYRKSKGLEKHQYLYLLLGITIMHIFLISANFIVVIIYKSSYFIQFGPLFSLTFLISATYAILRHRLLEIRLLVARTVTYTLLLGGLVAIYTGLIFGLTFLLPTTANRTLISAVLALIVAFSFNPLKNIFERISDRYLYKKNYETNNLLNTLSRTMASTLTLSDLTYKLLNLLTSQMRITRGAFILRQDKKIYILESDHQHDHLSLSNNQYARLKKINRILIFDEMKENKTKELLRSKGLYIVVPLSTKKHFIGFLTLFEKSSGDIYFDQDIKVLEILGPELAIALQNAQRFEEISQFNVTLQEEVKRATANLRRANERLRELDKLKDEFVSIASHELRTPVTAVKGYLWMVQNKGKLPKKTAEMLSIAYKATEHMISLVNNMLDVSRIEGGRLKVDIRKINLAEIASQVENEILPKAQEKNMTLKFDLPKKVMVKADTEKLTQVFFNLVGNAIKYTPDNGTIEVYVEIKKTFVETFIKDNGIGIKSQDMHKLFTKFGRLDTSFAGMSQVKGTGLGLYITKKIVELMNGEMHVVSESDKGSTFSFTLPKG